MQVFEHAVKTAEKLKGCVGFAVHRELGVLWINPQATLPLVLTLALTLALALALIRVMWINPQAISSVKSGQGGTIPSKSGWVTWVYHGRPCRALEPLTAHEVIEVGEAVPEKGMAEASEGAAVEEKVGDEAEAEAEEEAAVEAVDEEMEEQDPEELFWDSRWDGLGLGSGSG